MLKTTYLFLLLVICQLQIVSGKTTDTIIFIAGTKVEIIIPEKQLKGTFLVLPGWNFQQNDICEKSNFCSFFSDKGYALILPNMLKSVYSSKLYNETRKDWLQYPTLPWLTDSLIPFIQKKYNLINNSQNNYLFGISTGGRGVAAVATHTGNLFKAGAALSGDYNQLLDLNDNLMRGYYGEYAKFSERWKGEDNPYLNANKIEIPLFLAHGKSDNIVPVQQTIEFYKELQRINPKLQHILNLKDSASHNYNFWGSEYPNVLEFFEKY
jgi:S-formylglutathione hydrolase FrmB